MMTPSAGPYGLAGQLDRLISTNNIVRGMVRGSQIRFQFIRFRPASSVSIQHPVRPRVSLHHVRNEF
jgi:hypothetical protein